MDSKQKISEHFYWGEFVRPNVEPPEDVKNNLKLLAAKLEEVRAYLGNKPMIINSGYRDPAHNRAVKGVSNSQHLYGKAADIAVVGMSPRIVQAKLKPWWPGGLGSYSDFTHLDIRSYRARW